MEWSGAIFSARWWWAAQSRYVGGGKGFSPSVTTTFFAVGGLQGQAPQIIGGDGELAAAAVDEHREFHAGGGGRDRNSSARAGPP